MARNIKKEIKLSRNIGYLNKDFDSFRTDLLSYANAHFSDQIKDFSEVGLGGLFVDMAAYVGDVMSFYLDHQFNELNLETAIEEENVERLIRNTGVEMVGAAPSFVAVNMYISVPAELAGSKFRPNHNYLPKIRAGTRVMATSGVIFELLEDFDFALKDDKTGKLVAPFKINQTNSAGVPINFIVYSAAIFSSASTAIETFTIGTNHVPFRTIELEKKDISEILSVLDHDLDEYYEVNSLSEDSVFKRVVNVDYDEKLVPNTLKVLAAPRRFTKSMNRKTGKTTIRFGAGKSDTYDNDIIPNPSDHALPLYGEKRTFKKFAIDPNKLLETQTLGVSPQNTTLTVRYKHGGGRSHNVKSSQITQVSTLLTQFNTGISSTIVRSIRDSFEVYNDGPAAGGADRPTLEELRVVALGFQNSQNRIVTQQDLLTRVYTMPSQLGRVYRAGIRKNPTNPNSVLMSVVTLGSDGKLTYTTDTLKKNIRTYINEFRLIADTIEILDAPIVNFAINFTITTDSRFNHNNVLVKVLTNLKDFLKTDTMQIDQPINMTDITTIITAMEGVLTLNRFEVKSRSGNFQSRVYGSKSFNILENTRKGLLYPPQGGIFEMKFPDDDITGKVI